MPRDPPAGYCHSSIPSDAAGYQAAFDGLRSANAAGWIANDGGIPVTLTDGRIIWMFGDTLIGSPPTLTDFVHNGFVVQTGACFRPVTAPIPDPAPGEFVWPTGAVQEGNTLLVVGFRMRMDGTAPLDFELVNIDVAVFSLPALVFQSITDLPLPTSPTYGENLLVEGQYVYAYGETRELVADGFPIPRHYVARAPVDDVMDASAWRFWRNVPVGQDPWASSNPQDADPMLFDNSDTGGPLAVFSVGFNGSYVGSAFPADVFSTDTILTWNGAGPAGPWTQRDVPAVTGVDSWYGQLDYPTRFAYGGRVVFDVPGGPIAQWSTNHESIPAILADPNLYKVWFATPAPGSIPPPVATWYLRNTNTPGPPDTRFAYGVPTYQPVVGDWDGNNTATIGAYVAGSWYLRNTNTPGPADVTVNYGTAAYTPVVGDWNGDRTDTIGAYVNGTWYLRNSNTPGPPDVTVNYGAAGYTPVVGDWDGNGTDTIGAYFNGTWYLRNSNTPGPPDVIVNYGAAGSTPVVGNWDGVGGDSIGAIG